VVSVIDKLEQRGLVERRAAVPDRRAHALVLTSSGTKLLRKLKGLVAEHEKRLCMNLSVDERAVLVGLLQRIFPELR
jgi:DNA-binding MarR family transcriptional regulator